MVENVLDGAYLNPTIGPRVVGLYVVGGTASAPTTDCEEDLVRHAGESDVWGRHLTILLGDHLEIVKELERFDDKRAAVLVARHVRMVLYFLEEVLGVKQAETDGRHERDHVLTPTNGFVVHPAQHALPRRLLALHVQLVA